MDYPLAYQPETSRMLLIGIVAIGLGILFLILAKVLRMVFRYWLPKPFLGDGFNNEWAELKKQEMAKSSESNMVLNPGSDWPNDDEAYRSREKVSSGSISTSPKTMAYELDDVEEIGQGEMSLLKEWLDDSTHSEDQWVENFYSRTRDYS